MSFNDTFSTGHIKTVNCGSEYGRMNLWQAGAGLTIDELATDGDGIDLGAVFCVLALHEGKAYFYRAWNYDNFDDFCDNAFSVFGGDEKLTEHSRKENVLMVG